MLNLLNIVKDYKAGDTKVEALRGVSIEFRESEFVSVLGPSGCGKTTLLNIIGGLDRYNSGDLFINGKSTKQFADGEWDAYRNHSIGFVFQNYNLIPHQTVLSNVELALTLSGVSKSERRQRAIEALTRVGLADQIKKKPNQMSGGQMQRVAIARALVNNPNILLADEPTGAIDSETSLQIMDILKDIAKDKLVIMVTHNPDLANKYSTRIINLLDGLIISDSNPYKAEKATDTDVVAQSLKPEKRHKKEKQPKLRKPSMSFITALSLSLNNLMTKKGRTFMTAFAGSIGIIGIALILSLSNGIQTYIDKVQEDTLSSYPITIEDETIDITSLMKSMQGIASNKSEHDLDKVYSSTIMMDMMNTMLTEIQTNNLETFKAFIESKESGIDEHISAFQFGYDLPLHVYATDTDNAITQVNPSKVMETIYGDAAQMYTSSPMASSYNMGLEVWEEMLGNSELLDSQYDVVAGRWPDAYNEITLIVDENNEISDMVMYALGLKNPEELKDIMQSAMTGTTYHTDATSYTYDEILDMTFKLVLQPDYYEYNEGRKTWDDYREDDEYMAKLIDNGLELKITGIIRPNEDAVSTAMHGAIGYTSALTEYVINEINKTELVQQQINNPDIDVFTGISFNVGNEDVDISMEDIHAYIATLDEEMQIQMQAYLDTLSKDQIITMFKEQMPPKMTESTYEENLNTLGVANLDIPSRINIYANSFKSKEAISDIIEEYNMKMIDEGKEENKINYTDFIGLMMSSVSTIINVISYVLIAFVAISLIVSSIMIGIITYISVLERTKEIGILRSIGASKKDISRVFNAETLIVGFVSGALGIIVTVLLTIPINIIIRALSGIQVGAALPVTGGIVLVLISMILTLIAGLIPSRVAAKKDPVVALRTE